MNTRKVLLYVATCALSVLPSVSSAAANCVGICNPLSPDFSTIPTFIAGFLRVMVQIGLPVVALFLLYSGFLFLKAQGNPEGLTKAKENFIYVIIGALLILGAWVLATLIGNTVGQVVGQNVTL